MLDWKKHTKLRILIRTICIVLVVTFLSYDLSWAGATEVLNPRNWFFAQKAQNSLSIEIPQELGLIKETFTSQYNPHKLVIHIQDAHANVEAQENEAKIIKYLKDKYNIHLVSVEGGFGDFDAGFFRSFPKDKGIREKIARYFLSKDFISGTDYLLVTEDEPPVVYGAEDKGLYESHLNTFKNNQGFSNSFNKSLSILENAVQTLKNKYYSKDLREFDLHLADFKQGKSSLEEYLSYLNIVALLHNFDLSQFPNLYLIISLKELENKISFEKAESERQALIDNLSKVLSKEGLEELVKKSIDFKANNLSAPEYYAYLERLTQSSGIASSGYPNLFSYIKYTKLSSHLDNTRIFAEIESFSKTVKDRFTTNSAQKDIDSLTYIIGVLKGLANIDLSPKDYEYFKSNRSTFTSKNITLILKRYLDSDALSSLPTDEDISSLEKFYSIAHDRDSAIVKNSLSRLDKDYSSNSVILVAGGFHTQGITSALKEKNISYIVIAPNIKASREKESTYFSLLKDKKLPIEDILHDPDALQIINSITDPQARDLLINYWVARSSRYYSPEELQAQLSNLRLSGEDRKSVEAALSEISGKTPEKTSQETNLAQELLSKTPPATVQVPAILWANFNKFISSMLQKIRKFIIVVLIFCTTACSSLAGTTRGIVNFNHHAVKPQIVQVAGPTAEEAVANVSQKKNLFNDEQLKAINDDFYTYLNAGNSARYHHIAGNVWTFYPAANAPNLFGPGAVIVFKDTPVEKDTGLKILGLNIGKSHNGRFIDFNVKDIGTVGLNLGKGTQVSGHIIKAGKLNIGAEAGVGGLVQAGAGLNFGEKRFPLDLKASIFEAPILETKYATVYPFSNPDGSWTWLDIKNPAGGIAKNIDSLTQDIKKGSGSIEKGQVVVVFGQATINEAIASSFKESERIRSLISQAEELPNSKAVLDALNAITIPDYLLDQHKAQITSQLIGLKARLSKEVEANSIKEALMSQINSATKASDITSEALTSPDYQVQQAAQEKLSNLIVQEEQAHQQELNKMREQNEKAQAQVARVQEEQAHQEFLKKIQEEEQKKAQAQLAQLQEKLLKIEAQVDKAQDDLAKASQEAITSQQEIEKLKAQQQETESRVAAQEEKNKTLETSLSNVNERLDKAEKRISGVENKVNDFKSYEKSWWQDQAGGWKTALYLLAAFGIGVASLRLFLYRKWSRLKTLKEEINNKLGERTELEKSLGVKKEELNVFAKQIEAAKLSLAELEKQRASQEETIKNAALELRRLQEESEKLRKANNLDTLTQEKERLTQAIGEIEKQITAKKERLSVLIAQEESKLLALISQVGQLEGEQAKYETAVQELKKKTDQYEAEVRALEQQKAKARQELAVLGDVSTVQAQVEEVNKKIREAEETLRRLNSEVSSLGTQKQNLEAELAGYRSDKTKLETGIITLTQEQQKLTLEVSSLQAQKDSLIQKETQLRASIEAKAAELKDIEEKIALLQAQNQESAPQTASLKAKKESLEKEIAKLSQYSADLIRESTAKRSSLDKDISQKQSLLGELTLKISQLTAQKSQLEQEIGVLSTKKQKENQGLDTAKKEKETITQEILLARQQIVQINTEITNLLSHVEELKQRGVNLDEEVPALTRRRDTLQGELQELEKTRQQIQEDIAKAQKDNQPQASQPGAVILPKPYAAMIFDVDNTLTDITTKIDKNLLELILSLLAQNVRIALVTVQSIDEVKEYIVEQVPKEQKNLLTNLAVYPSAGAKRFSFDAQGNPINDQEYDTTVGLTLTVNPNEIKTAIQQVVGANAGVGLRDGAITITNLSSREETMGKLATLFKKEGWNLVPRVAGGHSIHLLIGGVDKGKAAAHFVKEVAAKAFNQEVPLRNVLVMGDSFYGGGLDADLASALEGADIVSVGKKPQGNQLRDLKAKGLFFSEDLVGIRNWQATFKILKEVMRGKTVRQIGRKDASGGSFSGAASILFALSTAIFSLFPTTISNAQMSLPSAPNYQSIQAPAETSPPTAKQLAEVFTLENYRGNIGTIDMAIKIISIEEIKDPKVLDGLKWTATTATLPENKYYPDTATNAVLALLKTDEGTKVLAEAIKDRIFIQQDTRFSNVLKTIGESKTDSPVILDALGWLMYNSSINETSYSSYAVKLATETLLHMGDKGMQEIVDSFNPENYGKFNVRDEALNTLAESKARNTRVVNKIYWLALEAVFDNGHYYVGYSCSAGKVLYQIEGNKALDKFTSALNDPGWRKSDGAAEAIIGIAKAQNGKLTPQIIAALNEVQKLGIAHDYRQTAVKEAESILKQFAPEKIEFFTPQRYHDYPQKMILDANMFATSQNTNFINDMARAVVYVEGDGSFNQGVLKACVESLLRLGDKGREVLDGIFTPENYQKAPANLKAAIDMINNSKITDQSLINRLAYLALEPSLTSGTKYNPGLNKTAIRAVLNSTDSGKEILQRLFVAENFRTKQAQLSLIADTLAENNNHSLDETFLSMLAFNNINPPIDASLKISIINALSSLQIHGDLTLMFNCLSSTDEGVRNAAVKALINLHVPQDQIEQFINSDNQLMKQSARDILKAIAPGRLEELTKPPVITPQAPLVQVTQEDTQKPEESWLSKLHNFNYGSLRIWAYVLGGLAILISGLVFYIRTQKVRVVYKQLLSYVGQTSFLERWRLKKASAILARKTHYDVDDVYKVIAEKLPEVYDTTKIERIEKIAKFLDKLNKAKVSSSQILHYGIPFMNQTAKDEKQFDKGLDILVDTARELQRNNINVDQIFAYSLSSINNYVREFSVFEAVCNLIKEMALHKQNPQEMLTTVAPEALRTAKDANVKVARLNIILNLVLEGIYPTQLLIETLEKTTSQSNLSQEIAKWLQLLKDFKSGAVKFDVTNPVHVDLEYTTFRQLSSQISQSNSYESYKNIIQQVRSTPGSASSVGSQEESEIKLAVYEAYRLLDFIIAVKNKADKLGRPVWVVPNLSYGQFAVSPILDDLGKLNIEVHTARIGSTECHSDPALVKPSLFSDDVYLRILKERPVIIAVDGTQHLLARPEERKSARYPDAYVGYRNFIVAMDEVLSGKNDEKFQDKVKVDKDFLSTLRQNSEYTSLVDKLSSLNSGLGQPSSLYRLEFWNPGGLELVVREARKEVQNITPFNPDDLDSPALIFINSPLLDEDLPADIKQWAALEQPHVPAFFDDRAQIQQTVLAVNERGVYLSHALDFEISKDTRELKDSYKGKVPQIVHQPATPESLRSMYEAMLFDLDGTLTDTLSVIDKSLLNKLLNFLDSGVVVGIVTSQSIDEVEKNLLDQVDSNRASALQSLVLFTARGAQAWGFDQNKHPYSIYDRSQTDLNDAQRTLIRQVVTQALGTLAQDTQVTDRKAQITIPLKKNKDKRDLVNATLNQLIANNNLPFQTEYSGSSTIHVILKGVDKGAAKDYFLNQVIPDRLKHPVDLSKLLVVGDRFQEGGSDRPMIVQGARIVSVGGKDKSIPPNIESYPQHGWKGTNQLLGDIINRAGKSTVSLPSVFIGMFGLSDFWNSLNAAGQGLYDAAKRPLLYLAVATLGIVFISVSIAIGVKLYKTNRIYSQIKDSVSFLKPGNKLALFKEISHRVSWKGSQDIDPYEFLLEILPLISKRTQDRRIQEMINTASRLEKLKINPRHIFKYMLPAIATKTSNEKQFIHTLSLSESFAIALQDKRYDYHQLLKEIMPSLNRTVRNNDELNEAILLGITLVSSGINPVLALSGMLPEVTALTKTPSEFKLGIYALQELCLEDFEPTKYLIAELIKQGTQAKIDQALSDWQEIRRKFKTGDIAFNPKNPLHVNLEYTTFREFVDRTLKQQHKYNFSEYLSVLNNFNHNNTPAHVKAREKAEIKYAAYEAFRFRQFVLEVKEQADKMNRNVWVVPNLSYGRFAVSPLIKDLISDGIEIHYARIGSTESHENPTLVKADLFSPALYSRIINEQPVIIVVDGTQHLLARPKDRKSARYPDAYVGYRNMIVAANDVLSSGQEQLFKSLVKTNGSFIRRIREKGEYRTLRRRFLRVYNPNIKTKRYLYDVEFWNPGGLELAVREARQEVSRVRPISASDITQPTLIFANSVMLDEDIPVLIHDWIDKTKQIHHKPAYFDDKSNILNLIFNVDAFGVNLSDAMNVNMRKEYKRIKSIYRPSFNLPAKPQNLPNLPYKAVISDLDGTLSDTLQEIPKPVMEKLLYLLSLGVQFAIVTTQSYKEVGKYLLSQVPLQNKALLQNLTIYSATGSQAFGFDKNGNPLAEPLYDLAQAKLTDQQMQGWRQIIKSLLEEYALDQEVKDKKGQVVATPVKIIDAGSQIIIRLKERAFLRPQLVKRLQVSLNREQLPITLKEIGRTSIRMTIRGIDKSSAVKYHLTKVCKDSFGFEPKPQEVLILGNSFDEDGDDRDMMIRGARVFSVGHKPAMHYLRGGVNFYSEHGWEGGDQVLAEFINIVSANLQAPHKPAPQAATVNSFILPFLASTSLTGQSDSSTVWIVGCLALIIGAITIFKNKLFPPEEQDQGNDTYSGNEPQADTTVTGKGNILSPKQEVKVLPDSSRALAVGFKQRNLENEFAVAETRIKQDYPGLRIGIIGAAMPAKGYSPEAGVELGRVLRGYVAGGGFIFTGGVSGVGVDVYQGVIDASGGQEDRFFVLLPEGMYAGRDYRDISPSKQVKTANFGEDMFERRVGMGRVADVIIVLNGRDGTLHEAISALRSNKKIIALDYGGAGSLLYQAKKNNKLTPILIESGLRMSDLNNMFLADITNIKEALNAALANASITKEDLTRESDILFTDPMSKALFNKSDTGKTVLSQQAVSAINSLNEAYNGLTLEVDVDTIIDTSKGTPQLKGLGFKEALASLYQAQEKKQIPDNLKVRLININPSLNKEKIIKALGLTDELLKGMVSIPEIPQDYLVKGLEPYLIQGSVRIIFEDNLRYWGKKVDVLVKRGKETETLSSIGLIVASLAKEPKFYESLPKDIKEYIVAKTDGKGKVELDDEGKIKQLIFKPIEKTKVDTQYLDRLNKANKELDGMV